MRTLSLLLCLILPLKNAVAEERCQGAAKPVLEISLPLSVIDEFLNPKKNSKNVYLPAPNDPCLKFEKTVRIKETMGRQVGDFTVEEQWQGGFNERALAGKAMNLGHHYRVLFRSRALPEYESVDALLRLIYNDHNYPNQLSIRILRGVLKPDAGYFPKWDQEEQPQAAGAVKILNYRDLIPLIDNKTATILDATQTPRNTVKNWRVPGAKLVSRQSIDDPPRRFLFSELIQFSKRADRRILPADNKTKMVVYTYPGSPAGALNVMDWLRLLGFTDINWFRGGASEWNDQPTGQTDLLSEFDEITAESLAKELNSKNLLLLDMRDRAQYLGGHIKNASAGTPHGYKGKVAASPRSGTEQRFFLEYNLKPEDANKTVVVYGTDENDPNLLYGARTLFQTKKVKPRVYRAGFQDWLARAQWLGENSGFSISTGATPAKE